MRIINSCLVISSLLSRSETSHAQSDTAVSATPHAILSKVQPFGYQSTTSTGNDFAASIVKSPRISQGYFATGTTSGMLLHTDEELGKSTLHAGMHCYVMQMKPFSESWTWMKKFGAFRNGSPTPTTCTSIRTLPVKEGDTDTKVVVSGYTEGDVLFNPDDGDLQFSVLSQLSEISRPELTTNKINGFTMILSVPLSEEEEQDDVDPQSVKVIGGKMLHADKVTYPISSTAVGKNDIVVVSMVTDQTGVNLETALKDASGDIGDFEPVFRYGQFFKVKVERLTFDPETSLVHKVWSVAHETDDGLGAHVSSVIYDELEDAVTIAGTTHGHGEAFGREEASASTESDLDGYFFTLHAETGKLVKKISKRVETEPGKDEIISGMCKKTRGDAIYVVGSTNHVIDEMFEPAYNEAPKFNAFIRKINLATMEPIWTRQIGPINIRNDHTKDNQDVMGMGCAVDEEKSQVYVSGTVAAGASVVPGQFPTGEQDIFVAGFQSTHGTPLDSFPTKQLGSVMDEYVAKDGGGLTTDQYGNAVLFGTTKGNFIQEKPPKRTQFQMPLADIYFMSFLNDKGEHVSTIERATPDGIETSVMGDGAPTESMATPFEVGAITMFALAAVVSVFLLAYTYGKRRVASQIEFQTGQDIARYLEDYEQDGNSSSSNNNNNNSNSNFAIGDEESRKSAAMSRRVSLPDGDVEHNPASSTSTSAPISQTYDDLMESYKNIMLETSAVTAVAVDASRKQSNNDENMIV